MNYLTATIEDAKGNVHYRIEGNYYEKLDLVHEKTGEKFRIFEAPNIPKATQDPSTIYGMNYLALQLNDLSDELKENLPPTDSRFRPDMRAWESCNNDKA